MKPLFIESMGVFDGKTPLLRFHQARFDHTRLAHFGLQDPVDLQKLIECLVIPSAGIFKIRIIYAQEVQSVTVEPYVNKEIQRFFLKPAGDIDYRFKYADRSWIDKVTSSLPDASEVIFVRDGQISDTSIHNILFYDTEENTWIAPEATLLQGVCLTYLRTQGFVRQRQIYVDTMSDGRYLKFRLINALNPLDRARDFPLSAIVKE